MDDEALARIVQAQELAETNTHAINELTGRLRSGLATALALENPQAQAEARNVIPVVKLTEQAAARAVEEGIAQQDALVKELLHWFKHSFFHWVDKPKCSGCGAETAHAGMGQPTHSDLAFGGNRVELYKCSACGGTTRFPRFNDAAKLLRTRRGRCGEWANCFTLCCRALGIEARWVLDVTDHVWTEVWSESLGRWVHCDSCENAWDQPHLYERGWGKKLSYVFGFSVGGAADISRRYSIDWQASLARRTAVPEHWLSAEIAGTTAYARANLPAERRAQLAARDAAEQAQLLAVGAAPPAAARAGEDLPGRQSGALEWRLARGEAGGSAAATAAGAAAASAGGASTSAPAGLPTGPEPSEAAVSAAAAAFVARAPVPVQDVVVRIIRNVIQEPGQPKFRRVKLANPRVAEALLAGGGLPVLLAAGFRAQAEPTGEQAAVFPDGASVDLLRFALQQLLKKPEPAAAAATPAADAAGGEAARGASADAAAAVTVAGPAATPLQSDATAPVAAAAAPPAAGGVGGAPAAPASPEPAAAAAGSADEAAAKKAAFQAAVKEEFERIVAAGEADRQKAAVAALSAVMARFAV